MNNKLSSKFHTVVDYVKNLVPTFQNKFYVPESTNPEMDAKALLYLTSYRAFFTYARNSKEYFYCFTQSEEDMRLVKYILRTNGINPSSHYSRFYGTPEKALRTRVKNIKANPRAWCFTSKVNELRAKSFIRNDDICSYINELKQKARN